MCVQMFCDPQTWRIWSLEVANEAGGGGNCGRDELSFCASVTAAQGVPGVPLAMLKTCRFSEGFVGTSPFLHHFFFSQHAGISWQAKTLLQNA